jgi:16S rRNA (guanine966-N2)-methyltransferase
LRIIGGNCGGRRLVSVKGSRVRPTTDKHRESIFNILSSETKGATVLDLFAGTGALGIEALSRGAEFAVFVDVYREAVAAISENLRTCSMENRAKIFRRDALKNLNCLGTFAFDLVFMDPPYDAEAVAPALLNLEKRGCLENEALIVAEHSLYEPFGDDLENFRLTDRRRYGKTLVSFFTFASRGQNRSLRHDLANIENKEETTRTV